MQCIVRSAFWLIISLPFLGLLTGCESVSDWLNERDFDYAVNNRTEVPISVIIDGDRNQVQTVAKQTTNTFRITKKYTDSWDDGRNGKIYVAQVSIVAESKPVSPATGSASSGTKRIWLYSNKTVTIEFDRNDFQRTGRGSTKFQLAITNNTTWGLTIRLNGNEFRNIGPETAIGTETDYLDAEFRDDVGSTKAVFAAFNGEKISKPKEVVLRTDRITNVAFTAADW